MFCGFFTAFDTHFIGLFNRKTAKKEVLRILNGKTFSLFLSLYLSRLTQIKNIEPTCEQMEL